MVAYPYSFSSINFAVRAKQDLKCPGVDPIPPRAVSTHVFPHIQQRRDCFYDPRETGAAIIAAPRTPKQDRKTDTNSYSYGESLNSSRGDSGGLAAKTEGPRNSGSRGGNQKTGA